MLPSTKQISLVPIAVMFGLALSVPLPPAFPAPAPSNIAMQNAADPPLRSGDLVRLRSGGPLMTVIGTEGDQVNCVWTYLDGHVGSEHFPTRAVERGVRILGGSFPPNPDPAPSAPPENE
jgi:uncharacterized protein YodC (DUF2158 family)